MRNSCAQDARPIETLISPQLIAGCSELETTASGVQPHRLPLWTRLQFPDPEVLWMERLPAGVRLRFKTDASWVELVSFPVRRAENSGRPRGRFDVFVDGTLQLRDALSGGDLIGVDSESQLAPADSARLHSTKLGNLSEGEKHIEIWLPYDESLELLKLRSDAPISPWSDRRPVWVHHGSSISQGWSADAPSETWPAIASTQGDVHLRNLSLGGNALVDPFIARVIRDTPADFISVKLGINVIGRDAMSLRSFVPAVHGFLDTIRDGHPATPLLVVSPVFCKIDEHIPGPFIIDPVSIEADQIKFIAADPASPTPDLIRLTLDSTRRALSSIVKGRSDPNLHYLDGTDIYGAADAEQHPLPDNLHPSGGAHRVMGTRFAEYAFGSSGPFSRHP